MEVIVKKIVDRKKNKEVSSIRFPSPRIPMEILEAMVQYNVNNRFKSFTIKATKRIIHDYAHPELIETGYSLELNIKITNNDFIPKEYRAAFDTRASHCFLSKRIVNELALKSFNCKRLDDKYFYMYKINLIFPQNIIFIDIDSFDDFGNMSPDIDIIIGMNVLHQMDFAFTKKDDEYLFTVRHPHKEPIDFTA